jgi:hypothetical protein
MQELLNVKAAGTYSYHSALKGLWKCFQSPGMVKKAAFGSQCVHRPFKENE